MSNKESTTLVGLYGRYLNYNPNTRDTVYSITYNYTDASSYGLDIKYCKSISKRLTLNVGLGFKNKIQKLQYSQYIDNNPFNTNYKY